MLAINAVGHRHRSRSIGCCTVWWSRGRWRPRQGRRSCRPRPPSSRGCRRSMSKCRTQVMKLMNSAWRLRRPAGRARGPVMQVVAGGRRTFAHGSPGWRRAADDPFRDHRRKHQRRTSGDDSSLRELGARAVLTGRGSGGSAQESIDPGGARPGLVPIRHFGGGPVVTAMVAAASERAGRCRRACSCGLDDDGGTVRAFGGDRVRGRWRMAGLAGPRRDFVFWR